MIEFLPGIQSHIQSPSNLIRKYGMVTAECFSRAAESPVNLDFELTPDEEITFLRSLVTFSVDEEEASDNQTKKEASDEKSEIPVDSLELMQDKKGETNPEAEADVKAAKTPGRFQKYLRDPDQLIRFDDSDSDTSNESLSSKEESDIDGFYFTKNQRCTAKRTKKKRHKILIISNSIITRIN